MDVGKVQKDMLLLVEEAEDGSINVFCDSFLNVPKGNVSGGFGSDSSSNEASLWDGGNGGSGQFSFHIITSTRRIGIRYLNKLKVKFKDNRLH